MWNDDVTPEVFLLDSHLIACEFRSSCVRVFLVLLRSELRNSRRNARKLFEFNHIFINYQIKYFP